MNEDLNVVAGWDQGNYEQWRTLEENSESEVQNSEDSANAEGQVTIGEYETYDEVTNAIRNLEAQQSWKQMTSEILDIIESSREDGETFGEVPRWRQNLRHLPGKDYYYNVNAITSYEYNHGDSTELAKPSEKRFLVGPEYGYAHIRYPGDRPDNINGFLKFSDDGSLPEETDFTFENREENKDIPDRINDVFFKLFGGNEFSYKERMILNGGNEYSDKYLDYREFPDDETLTSILAEMRSIINDIGEDEVLEKKIELLEQRQDEIRKAEQEAKERKERLRDQQKLSEIVDTMKNGSKLTLEDLRLVFNDKYDDDASAMSIRNNLSIEEAAMKQLLEHSWSKR